MTRARGSAKVASMTVARLGWGARCAIAVCFVGLARGVYFAGSVGGGSAVSYLPFAP